MSIALTVMGAVLLMSGAIMASVGEAMRLKSPGGARPLVEGGLALAFCGLACGAALLLVMVFGRSGRARQGRLRASRADRNAEPAEEWLSQFRPVRDRRDAPRRGDLPRDPSVPGSDGWSTRGQADRRPQQAQYGETMYSTSIAASGPASAAGWNPADGETASAGHRVPASAAVSDAAGLRGGGPAPEWVAEPERGAWMTLEDTTAELSAIPAAGITAAGLPRRPRRQASSQSFDEPRESEPVSVWEPVRRQPAPAPAPEPGTDSGWDTAKDPGAERGPGAARGPAEPPAANAESGAARAKLDQLRDLYLTAEAIGDDALARHFDEVSQRQRQLIREYFEQVRRGTERS